MARIKCDITETTLEGDYGNGVESITATCSKCGHYTESYGTEEGSIKRCLALMNEECPKRENNYYVEAS
jgi:hypothetical protein